MTKRRWEHRYNLSAVIVTGTAAIIGAVTAIMGAGTGAAFSLFHRRRRLYWGHLFCESVVDTNLWCD